MDDGERNYDQAVAVRTKLRRKLRWRRGVRSVAIDVIAPGTFGVVIGVTRSVRGINDAIDGVPVRVVIEDRASHR